MSGLPSETRDGSDRPSVVVSRVVIDAIEDIFRDVLDNGTVIHEIKKHLLPLDPPEAFELICDQCRCVIPMNVCSCDNSVWFTGYCAECEEAHETTRCNQVTREESFWS